MNKEKILSLSNTEDAMWYKLSPGDETLKKIDLIFDIYDNLYEEDSENIHAYSYHISSGDMHFHKETKNFIVYFIFTKNSAHIILRKTLDWKKYDKEIYNNFEFID
jgi:hypothetical protein